MKPTAPFLILAIAATFITVASAQESKEAPRETFVFDTAWRGERIKLPPAFAPDMGFKGIEEIRFAPGMFDAKSDTFFTYVFVFAVPADQALNLEIIQKEMLTYYRGLAKAVLKGKNIEVDTAKFAFALAQSATVKDAPQSVAKPEAEFTGKLEWVEPFATAKDQTLHFEIQTWTDAKAAMRYLFVCASPKAPTEADPVWRTLRGIRRSFKVVGP
jgi:hypothetical protein